MIDRDGALPSLWQATTTKTRDSYSTDKLLPNSEPFEVIVVGGGITGMTTAPAGDGFPLCAGRSRHPLLWHYRRHHRPSQYTARHPLYYDRQKFRERSRRAGGTGYPRSDQTDSRQLRKILHRCGLRAANCVCLFTKRRAVRRTRRNAQGEHRCRRIDREITTPACGRCGLPAPCNRSTKLPRRIL